MSLSALSAVAIAFAAHYWQSLDRDMAKRFPTIDPKIRRKAFRQFLKNARANMYYGDMESFSDEYMDQLFLDIVHEMTPPK